MNSGLYAVNSILLPALAPACASEYRAHPPDLRREWALIGTGGRKMRVQLSRQRLLMGLGYVTVGTLAFLYGRSDTVARAKAEPPELAAAPQTNAAGLVPAAATDYGKRVVAYIYGT